MERGAKSTLELLVDLVQAFQEANKQTNKQTEINTNLGDSASVQCCFGLTLLQARFKFNPMQNSNSKNYFGVFEHQVRTAGNSGRMKLCQVIPDKTDQLQLISLGAKTGLGACEHPGMSQKWLRICNIVHIGAAWSVGLELFVELVQTFQEARQTPPAKAINLPGRTHLTWGMQERLYHKWESVSWDR